MARDVEFNVTASDKTGAALAEAEAKFKASQERIRKESKKTGDSVGEDIKKGVDKSAPGILGKLKNTFGVGGMSGGELLAVGIAAASPAIGAVISAAIIGGAGVGGVVGGVVLAARDPRVAAAGAQLGETLLGELTKDAQPFIDPVLKSIDKIEVRFGQMNGRIKNIFANSAGFLGPLVDGALDAVDGILRGVDSLVAKGKPVIDALGRSFRTIGDATGKALDVIAGGSDHAADALDDLAQVIGVVIEAGGYLIRGLTELYGFITFLPRHVESYEKSLFGMQDGQKASSASASVMASVMGTVGKVVLSAGEAAGQAGLNMQTYTEKMGAAAQVGHSLYDSQTAVAQSIADAQKALKENGKTLDLNTQKGRDNRRSLSEVASGLLAVYTGYVNVNGEGAGAAKIAERNRESFIKLARQFGLSKKAAADLATQMGLLPGKKTTDFYANTHDADGRIKALQDKINATHGKTVTVKVSVTGTERLDNLGHRIGGYSAGGMSWAAADRNSGVSRTGGPTPVSVNNSFGVYINGVMDRRSTVQVVDERSARDAWRQKVGRRK